ncbi:MAG: hypothetical protein VXW38_03020 [Bacteroidota bacterium]|nr:hypothetical protein [Bacteroidota bacterium]
MKKVPLFTYISLFLLLGACSKGEDQAKLPEENPTNEEPKSEIYFTLNVSQNIIPDSYEEWVLIHDLNGNLMDYKMVQNGETATFEALDTEIKATYNITKLTRTLFSDGETSRYFLNTYTNIPKGSIWNYAGTNLNTTSEVNPDVDGSFSLNVYNIPPTYRFSICSLENPFVYGSYFDLRNTSQLSLPEVDLFETSNYILSILDGNNELKYTYLENIQADGNLDLDYSQFLDFDKYITIDLPNQDIDYNYFIDGLGENIDYPGNVGYEYQSNLGEFGDPPYRPYLKLGYLDIFSKFKTYFGITMNDDNYTYTFYKQGTPPNAILIPEKPIFTISAESMDRLEFSIDKEYQYYVISWRAEQETGRPEPDLTLWKVYSENDSNTVMSEMPEEIRLKYPTLNLVDMEYQDVNLYLQDETYNDFLDKSYISNYSKSNSEFTSEVIVLH